MLLLALALDVLTVEPLKDPAPVAEAVRRVLRADGLRLLRGGKPYMDFWFRAAVPQQPPSSDANLRFGTLKAGSLIGALRVHGESRDYRDQKFPAGAYTLRYGIQPEDGDHQGVSESKDYLLLAKAEADAAPADLPQDALHKLSAKVVGKKHPAMLYMVEPSGAGDGLPRVVHDESAERWRLEAAWDVEGGGRLRVSIVVVGHAPEF